MSDELDLHKHKLSEAHRLGYSGDAAVSFADRIIGDSREDVTADAERWASELAGWKASLEPVPDRAVDPSQGHGAPPERSGNGLTDFTEMMDDFFMGTRR